MKISYTAIAILTLAITLATKPLCAQKISTTRDLVAAVRDGQAGLELRLDAGVFQLDTPLVLKTGVKLVGAGSGKTVITHAAAWKPSTTALPKGEVRPEQADDSAYLIRLKDKATDITIENLSLIGPQMHGAIFGTRNQRVHLHHLRIENVLYCGIRTYFMRESQIHDCDFIGAGGKWKKGGVPGTDGGISGGAIFVTWPSDSEISHNRVSSGPVNRRPGKSGNHFGIKGRGGRRVHIHHNTIGVNFSIEFPFEGNEDMEIDHNILHGVVSIPKHGGGKVMPDDRRSFHMHHNYFTTSYAIEFPRNNVEIDHNLFDFDVANDGGNLVSGFGGVASPGPAWFHNNLVNNPGRGVIWNERAFSRIEVRNNHIITRTTATPRKEGLFSIGGSDFSQTKITDNIIECRGQSRPLLRRDAMAAAEIRNSRLINVADTDRYENASTDVKPGLETPLRFKCGVHEEMTVDGWNTSTK